MGFTGVEEACGPTGKVVLGCGLDCCGVGGSGVLVCLLGGSSFIGLRRTLSEKHLSRGELVKCEINKHYQIYIGTQL